MEQFVAVSVPVAIIVANSVAIPGTWTERLFGSTDATRAVGQVVLHLIPSGVLVTVPVPVPALPTVRLTGCRSNVAVTVVAAVSVTVQVPVPLHPPPLQ